MSFGTTLLAVVVGIFVWDILQAVMKALCAWISDKHHGRHPGKKRRIGFGDEEDADSDIKGATMRKIGFGAND